MNTFRKLLPEERAALEATLKYHKEQCTEISSQLNAGLQPVGLPEELLLEIFKTHLARWNMSQFHEVKAEATPLTLAEKDSEVLGWLPITQVCRRWRNVALNAPSLWTTIRVSNWDCVTTFIERSRGLPLSVEGFLKADDELIRSTIWLWQLVFQQSHRTRSLKISYTQTARVPERYLIDLDFDEPEFPILENLYIRVSNGESMPPGLTLELPPMLKALERHPALKQLTAKNLRQPVVQPLLSSTLQSLSLTNFAYSASANDRWVSLLTLLKRLPRLEHLQLRGGLPPVPADMAQIELLRQLPLILSEPVSLPKLRTLHMNSPSYALPAALLMRNVSTPGDCQVEGLVGEVNRVAMPGKLMHLAQLLGNKLDARIKGPHATPHLTLMVDVCESTEPTTPNAYVSAWTTATPIQPEPSVGIFPRTLLQCATAFQLDLHDFALGNVLADVLPRLPLAALDALVLGFYTPRFVPPPHAPRELPSADALRAALAPAAALRTLTVRGRMAERLPALLAPPADGTAPLFPALRTLVLAETAFLEDDPAGARPRRGAWWAAFTDALRAREKASPALRLAQISVKAATSITPRDVEVLKEFANEVAWDEWQGDDLESLVDEDERLEIDTSEA